MFCAQCGTSNKDSDRFCTRCGAGLGQNVAAAAIAPAAAIMAAGGLGLSGPPATLRREGDKLIVPRNVTTLPPYCVRCGAPADKSVNKNFGWHQPWLYVLIFFPGLLIYAIVATIVTKRQRLAVPICDAHRQRRHLFIGIGWALLAACFPAGAFIGNLGNDTGGWGVLAFLVTMAAGFVCFVIGTRLMTPKVIDDLQGVYGGASPVFLDRIAVQAQGAAGC